MNLSHLFAIAEERNPAKAALRFAAGDGAPEELSYGELLGAAGRVAAALGAWGLRRGDRIAFFLGNRPELVVAYLAAARLGAVVVPVNLAYRRRELAHILTDARPRLLLTEREHLGLLDELAAAERESVERVLLAEELADLEGPETLPPTVVRSSDPALIMYTSGTTGRSKGAVLTHGNLLATVSALLAAWGWTSGDVLLLALPLFHVHGLVVGLTCCLAAGGTVMLRERFEPAAELRELESGVPTLFFGVPTMYRRLLEEIRAARPDLGGMRLFCSGSAPLAKETFEEFRALTGHLILERYGMTETGMLLSNPYRGRRVAGSVGLPLPGVSVRLVDAEGREVEPGREGELLVRGGNVFDGYWQAPQKTAEAFTGDAQGRRWFRTGDLAREDPESGYFTLLGRRHELIISGGYNIYPREVEEVLASYPGVREAAVVGRSHPDWGEVPVAYLGASEGIDLGGLEAFCRRQMAAFKVPRTYHLVDALPRNALGKVQKQLLPTAGGVDPERGAKATD